MSPKSKGRGRGSSTGRGRGRGGGRGGRGAISAVGSRTVMMNGKVVTTAQKAKEEEKRLR